MTSERPTRPTMTEVPIPDFDEVGDPPDLDASWRPTMTEPLTEARARMLSAAGRFHSGSHVFTEAGERLARNLRTLNLTDDPNDRWPDDDIRAIEDEAAAAERERIAPLLQDIYDHFMPMHSGPCANQDAYDEDAPCICETGPIVERLCAALEAHDDH